MLNQWSLANFKEVHLQLLLHKVIETCFCSSFFLCLCFSLCSSQRQLCKMIWYKQGISFPSHCSLPVCSVLTGQHVTNTHTLLFASPDTGAAGTFIYRNWSWKGGSVSQVIPASTGILKSQKRERKGRERRGGKGIIALLPFTQTHTGNATTPHCFLESVCLLMLPLKFPDSALQLQLSRNVTAKS